MSHAIKFITAVIVSLMMTNILADTTIVMNFTTPNNLSETAGNIVISETRYGLLFTPHLQGLTPGIHGFHIHQNPDCTQNGMAAGGHFDPLKSGKHLGPYNDQGHLGDLPALFVNADGSVTLPVLAPRIKHLAELNQHALMIHGSGDNYSDIPEKLGGGGARMVCGIIH